MNNLASIEIENNSELGLVVSSRTVAKELGRQHKHVLEGIDEMIKNSTNYSYFFLLSFTTSLSTTLKVKYGLKFFW